MKALLVLPILVPICTAILAVFFRRRERLEHGMALVGALLQLLVALFLLATVVADGIVALWVGGWPAPYGICLVADNLSAVMVLITAVIHAAVTVYSRRDIDYEMVRTGYYPLLNMLTAAICGAFLTGDLFNLYVWFEVMLMASFGLLVMGQRPCQLTGAVKYVAINLISTLLFITAIGLLYGLTGTLNMADLHLKVALVENTALLTATAMLLLVAFAIKAALFPLFFWLPASYHTLPVAVSAYFAGMLSKVGIYALLRMFTLVFPGGGITHSTLLVAAALTMLFGVVGAASQMEVRRILSFHIISQVGYMALGLALFTPLALAGAIVYLIHHIIVKANLFLVSGLIRQAGGGTLHLKRIGGLYREQGLVALAFFIPAFALAGFPPLSGFWAKLLIIRAALEIEQYGVAVLAAAVGLLTVLSMVKIWNEAFWKPSPGEAAVVLARSAGESPGAGRSISPWLLAPVLVLALATVVLGLSMEPVLRYALTAAAQLLEPQAYVNAVLGGKP